MPNLYYAPERPLFNLVFYGIGGEMLFKKTYLNIFLAGTIDMGNSIDWQKSIADYIERTYPEEKRINIFNPRRLDFDSSQEQSIHNPYFKEQVNWELDYLELSNIIVFNFEPNSKSPITIGELYHHVSDRDKTLLVSCPNTFYRKGNIDILCDRFRVPVFEDINFMCSQLGKEIDKWILFKNKNNQ